MECTANDNTSEERHVRSEVEVEHNTPDGNANAHMGETDLNVENPVRRPSSESQQPANVDPYVGMRGDGSPPLVSHGQLPCSLPDGIHSMEMEWCSWV
ncbi:hypothetical protein MRB53_026912 [Persea americana]|uniref:Uncharacterized protein n=1 Tax=Persea americana TaxID=3435 RepID=A0ACC2LKP5_PERAE|nr:hypothetical protein MRB53_026912 [Persea americana]